MSLNLYDVLDVDEGASAAEIRTAWKTAIADLDPTDRRFRAYNEAAGVLLDADKRASYDAELAAERVEEEPAGEVVRDPETADQSVAVTADGVVDGSEDAAAEPETAAQEEPAAPGDALGDVEADEGEPDDAEPDPTAPEAVEPEANAPAKGSAGRFADAPPGSVLGAVGLLAAMALALAIWVATWPGTFGDTSPIEREHLQRDAVSAVAAAEAAAESVLGYDYRTIGQGLGDAEALLTPKYAKTQNELLAELRPEIEAQKKVVTPAVRASGVAKLDESGTQALVVVFLDQLVQSNGQTEGQLWQAMTLQMVRDDGSWLLEKICTTDPDCGE